MAKNQNDTQPQDRVTKLKQLESNLIDKVQKKFVNDNQGVPDSWIELIKIIGHNTSEAQAIEQSADDVSEVEELQAAVVDLERKVEKLQNEKNQTRPSSSTQNPIKKTTSSPTKQSQSNQ